MSKLRITKIEVHEFATESRDLGRDHNGFNVVYEPGSVLNRTGSALRVFTNEGMTGEYARDNSAGFAQFHSFAGYYLGKDPMQREKLYNDVKRGLRHVDKTGMGAIDIALWDLAGRYYDASVTDLLGGWRTSLPCYASTTHGDRNGGLDSPQAYADFAVRCKELGYPAFKIHGWGDPILRQEIATVLAVREAVGPEMDLMLDPACELDTFMQAVQLGRACDEANFFWLEDPYKDTGVSIHAHRKLRELIRTPLLQTEHIRGFEQKVDFMAAGATDLMRVNANLDSGLTGAMKIAHAAEGFGLDVEVHGPGPAHRALMASLRNTNYYEMGLVHPNIEGGTHRGVLYADDYRDGLEAVDANGHVPVPTGPGLGVTYNWDYIMANRTGGITYE